MTTPTYTTASLEEALELLEVIGHLRANNGKLLRDILKMLAKGHSADHRRLAETLVHHPNPARPSSPLMELAGGRVSASL